MGISPVEPPFGYLVEQVQSDLRRAAGLCQNIKHDRHISHVHKNLDELETALSAGSGFVRGLLPASKIPGADADGGDDISRGDFTGYVIQVKEIGSRLENMAHPSVHHPGHHHHSLLFPALFDPPHHHHHEQEDAHFHELKLKWDSVQDGIVRTFADLRDRLAQKVKKEADDKPAEEKEKEEKGMKEKAEKEKEEGV